MRVPVADDSPMGVGDARGAVPRRARSRTDSTRQFGALLLRASVIAGAIHVAFLGLALGYGLHLLAAVNVLSVGCYVWTGVLARRDHISLGLTIVVAEVLAHAVAATVLIGWDTGFYHFVLLVIPVLMVWEMPSRAHKVGSVCAGFLGCIALDVLLRHRPAPTNLPSPVVDGLYYFNLVGALLILCFLIGSYSQIVGEAQRTLRQAAETDLLTGLHNRRAATDRIMEAEGRRSREGTPVSVLMVDVDRFKTVNDAFGHDMGDQVLRSVSMRIVSVLREQDVVARWGGEEFLVLLPDAGLTSAARTAERIRAEVEGRALVPVGSRPVTVTVGTATLTAGETAYDAIARADRALLEGKRRGRNQVVQLEHAQEAARTGGRPPGAPVP